MTFIYKIVPADIWRAAQAKGVFEGAGIDLHDGYIHFSTQAQAQETADKHFAGQKDLWLVAVTSEACGTALRWETSRGGQAFPHLYAPLKTSDAHSVVAIPERNGKPDLSGLLA